MSYEAAYEINKGDILERIESLCRRYTVGGSFTDDSTISLADVERYIDDAYYWVVAELAHWGYGTAAANNNVKGVLQQLQALDAACQIEYAQASVGDEGFYKSLVARRDGLSGKFIRSAALDVLGQTRDRPLSNDIEMTGRSISRKRTVYTDSDVVQPRFPRGFGRSTNVPSRSGIDTPGGADPNQQ